VLSGTELIDVALLRDIRACRVCADHLPLGPRPIVQFSRTSRIVIMGQAPGSRVHATGIPWNDPSGERLRQWTGLSAEEFYDPALVALVPMGFCYPGRASGGDLPPRRECAPLWHTRVLALVPPDRLTLLVGTYAQKHYLPPDRRRSLTDAVRYLPSAHENLLALPHPAWRSVLWMRRNPWFESEIVPAVAARIRALVTSAKAESTQ
jgi:uracil-DNA glycosylase